MALIAYGLPGRGRSAPGLADFRRTTPAVGRRAPRRYLATSQVKERFSLGTSTALPSTST